MKKILIILILLIYSTAFGLTSTNPSLENCVGYWTLNEDDATGTSIDDKSGNGNTGTSANTPSFTADQNGVPNQAMTFDGSSDYVNMGQVLNIGDADMTVSGWVKFDDKEIQTVLSKTSGAGSSDCSYRILLNSSTGLEFARGNGATAIKVSFPYADIETDTWYFFTGIDDGTNIYMYINGILINTTSRSITPLSLPSNNFYIGRLYTGNNMDGSISDVAIYSSALTADEVSQLYKAGRTTAKVKVDARDLVTNGGFDTDTDWTKGACWTISGGTANFDGTDTGKAIYQTIASSLIEGNTYKVVYTFDNLGDGNAGIYIRLGNTWAGPRNETGVNTVNIVAGNTEIFIFEGCAGYPLKIDNVSVVDITNRIIIKK